MTNQAYEVSRGERFEFGENWRRFLDVVNDERIMEARRSLDEMLGASALDGVRVLDIGSGSGLFSLAAVQLGASSVHSFDYDSSSVACTSEVKRRFASEAEDWTIEQGSVLDTGYVGSLGQFDLVYSWGVLHHTGDMWTAIDNAAQAVADGGTLFIAIYNDQGSHSRRWRRIKKIYNELPERFRTAYVVSVMGPLELRSAVKSLVRGRPKAYVRQWTEYRRSRGMSRWHDLVDWCGGYPFEVSSPDAVVDFLLERGFRVAKIKTRLGGWGCNEFVFIKNTS